MTEAARQGSNQVKGEPAFLKHVRRGPALNRHTACWRATRGVGSHIKAGDMVVTYATLSGHGRIHLIPKSGTALGRSTGWSIAIPTVEEAIAVGALVPLNDNHLLVQSMPRWRRSSVWGPRLRLLK